MKKIKRTITFILAILIFTLSLTTFDIFNVSAESLRYGETVISKMNNSNSLKIAYDRLVTGCNKAEERIDLYDIKLTKDEFITVFEIFLSDYPEYFWVSSTDYKYIIAGTHIKEVQPKYLFEKSKISSAKLEFESIVSKITKDLGGKSDYEKSVILHDRLIKNTEYDFGLNDQNAYGALVEGKAVCAGYTRAYQHLLHKVGIPSWFVSGVAGDINHAWNLVNLKDKWYYTDITWDDQGENTFYAYLNCTKKQIEKDHTFDTKFEPYLPLANSTEANYFAVNDLIYSNVDVNRIANNLKANGYTTRIFVNGNIDSFKKSLNENLLQIAKQAGLQSGYSYSTLTSSQGNEIIFKLNFIEPGHIHKLSLVNGKTPTCTTRGYKKYYKCDCGKLFLNKDATGEIIDIRNIEIPTTPHKSSDWKTFDVEHYKECTVCGIEIAGTTEEHRDNNKDYKCDVCGYNLAKIQNTPVSSPNTTTEENDTINPNQTTQSTEDISSEVDNNTNTNPIKLNNDKPILLVIIILNCALILGITIGIIAFFVRRKK